MVGHETDATHLDGLLGLASLAYLIQAALGAAAGRTDTAWVRARQDQWTTTDRLCYFWRGRQVLHDRALDWRPWVHAELATLRHQPAPSPPPLPQFSRWSFIRRLPSVTSQRQILPTPEGSSPRARRCDRAQEDEPPAYDAQHDI